MGGGAGTGLEARACPNACLQWRCVCCRYSWVGKRCGDATFGFANLRFTSRRPPDNFRPSLRGEHHFTIHRRASWKLVYHSLRKCGSARSKRLCEQFDCIGHCRPRMRPECLGGSCCTRLPRWEQITGRPAGDAHVPNTSPSRASASRKPMKRYTVRITDGSRHNCC